MTLTYSKLCALNDLLKRTEFTWPDICPAIFESPVEAIEFLNELILNSGSSDPQILCPRPEPLQPDSSKAVWDGCFAMIDDKPAYVGTDGPSGGSGGPGTHIFLKPDHIILFF